MSRRKILYYYLGVYYFRKTRLKYEYLLQLNSSGWQCTVPLSTSTAVAVV
jgi:hypothetical protein